MGSATAGGIPCNPEATKPAIAESTVDRSSAGRDARTLDAEIPQLQHAVGAFYQLFYSRLSFAELARRLAEELDALLKEAERLIQLEALVLQLSYDRFQAVEVFLE